MKPGRLLLAPVVPFLFSACATLPVLPPQILPAIDTFRKLFFTTSSRRKYFKSFTLRRVNLTEFYQGRKGCQTGFWPCRWVGSRAQDRKRPQPIGGDSRQPKVAIANHSNRGNPTLIEYIIPISLYPYAHNSRVPLINLFYIKV